MRAFPRDEDAVFPVLEAVMVAILILAAILFFTQAQRSASGGETAGVDLGQVASDALQILQTHALTVTNSTLCPTAPLPVGQQNLTAWVTLVMNGDCNTAQAADLFLSQVAATGGARYQLRLDNGVNATVIVPWNAPDKPNNGRAAEGVLLPSWKVFAGKVTNATVWPGKQVAALPAPAASVAFNFTSSASSVKCIKSPTGAAKGPGGFNWTQTGAGATWFAHPGRIPATALYGVWASFTNAACTTGGQFLRVGLASMPPGIPQTDTPLYGLQLVVWFGA
ncbi:MAG: hypothetical protein ACYDBQ_09445 [Thermoplasmatota archaeon]